jgi:radical SAM superfamily enzyme
MDRAGRIAAVLRERRLRVPFSIMTRADTVCDFPEAFHELKGVGLYHVFLGLESSDEDTLWKFGKGVSPEEGRTAVGILDRLGITVTCGTILFHPWMSRKSLLSDIGYLRGLMDEFKGVCFLGLNELDVFEGTPISAGYRSGVMEWRCDWQAERPRMQEVYDRWRRIQASILFPAMRLAPPGRDITLRRTYAYWQLDVLRAMLHRDTDKGAADHVGDAYASMCRLLNAHAGTKGVEGFLGWNSAHVRGREETGPQERCFL